jgi:hypothetical protein
VTPLQSFDILNSELEAVLTKLKRIYRTTMEKLKDLERRRAAGLLAAQHAEDPHIVPPDYYLGNGRVPPWVYGSGLGGLLFPPPSTGDSGTGLPSDGTNTGLPGDTGGG